MEKCRGNCIQILKITFQLTCNFTWWILGNSTACQPAWTEWGFFSSFYFLSLLGYCNKLVLTLVSGSGVILDLKVGVWRQCCGLGTWLNSLAVVPWPAGAVSCTSPSLLFLHMVIENYLCTLRFNPSHIRLCNVPALNADVTLFIFTHRAGISHISLSELQSWWLKSPFCDLLTARWHHVWPGSSRGRMCLPLALLVSWTWALSCQQPNVPTCSHWDACTPPVLVPAWWHGVISQLTAAGTQSCLPACPQQQRLLTGSCAPSPRGAGLRKGVRAEDGEWCSAGAGRSWRWAERVVETEKKNRILQLGGSGVVDLPHHSSQWPTHLFWHKYSLWSCVEAWRRCVPLHLRSSGFVAALLKSELHVLMFCLETQAFRFVILPFQPFPWFTLQSKHSFVPCPRLPFPCLCCWLNFEIWYSSQRCLLGTKKTPNS